MLQASDTSLEQLYREEVLDHWRAPRNRGRLPTPDAAAEDDNPLCGDRIRIELKLDGDRIEQIRFDGVGCVISQAAASMLTERVEGWRLDEAQALSNDTVLSMFGGRLTPIRTKCALLALRVLKAAVRQRTTSSRSSTHSETCDPSCRRPALLA